MISTIAARRLLGSGGVLDYPLISIEDDRISRIESLTPLEYESVGATHRFPDATLVPAYVDVHVHGCAGHDVMEATPAAIGAIGTYLAGRGVGAYLPTTVTSPRDETMRSLAGLAAEIRRGTGRASRRYSFGDTSGRTISFAFKTRGSFKRIA